jgi:hypothetical protein
LKQNRQLIFLYKILYDLVAEPAKAGEANLTIPHWLRILKIVRTHFAACGGEEKPSKNSVRLRRDLQNCQRT